MKKAEQVREKLLSAAESLSAKTAVLGFDGFIDFIMRPVKDVHPGKAPVFFQDMKEFGSHISGRAGKSCIIEIRTQERKMGGNTPIMANALGSLGLRVACLGALGKAEIDSAFSGMPQNCMLISVSDPGLCYALEFSDGKVMLARNEGLEEITWESVLASVGRERLGSLFANSDCVALVNWAELDHASEIWKGLLSDTLKPGIPPKERFIFFDLADCSKRSDEQIAEALSLIREFGKSRRTVLGLNAHEAERVSVALGNAPASGVRDLGESLYRDGYADILVIHPRAESLAWDGGGMHREASALIENPRISTGGGDNFNAGFCLAQLAGCGTGESLLLANAVACFYIQKGRSPSMSEIAEFLLRWQY